MSFEDIGNMEKRKFDPSHSELESDKKKTEKYKRLLEEEIGHNFEVEAIIEMGSYAKNEAVPGSDIDTRVYVSSPDYYLRQTSGNRFSDLRQAEGDNSFSDFLKTVDEKPTLTFDWYKFNEPKIKKLSEKVDANVEFGLVDIRFAEYELSQLSVRPTQEHQLILQSNIVYDASEWIKEKKSEIEGIKYPALASFYKERYLDNLPFEIYTHLQPQRMDLFKLEKSRQIQWVKWAVRSLRDAVGAKAYIQTGRFIFKKDDILNFCYEHLSADDFKTVEELYDWKTDPEIRGKMVDNFLKEQDKCFLLFSEYTKRLEKIVKKIENL